MAELSLEGIVAAPSQAETPVTDTIVAGENNPSETGPSKGHEASAAFTLEAPAPAAPRAEPRPKKAEPKAEPEEASQSPFSVAIGQVYDGPFDLLLDLIRKQNIDVYDIPIARITAQFLEYTRHLQAVDIDTAGDFVYTAALLIHIKSRTLLPREPSEARSTLEPEDPRRELVERLLEHERFKAAAQMLQQKQQIEEATWTQPGLKRFLSEQDGEAAPDGEGEIAADTGDLVRVFRDILQRLRERPVHRIDEESVTVRDMIEFLKRRLLLADRPLSLRRLLRSAQSERGLICTFLAMLELVRLGAVLLRQPENFGDILLKKTSKFEDVMEDNAQVRDDWD